MTAEPRWTVRMDGDAVVVTLRARGTPGAWLPRLVLALLVLPFAASAAAWGAIGVVASAASGEDVSSRAIGVVLVTAYFGLVAGVLARVVLRSAARIAWVAGGHERIEIRPDRVDVERTGPWLGRTASIPRRAGAARTDVVPHPWLARLGYHLGRPGDRGGLRVSVPGGDDLLVGLDLTRDETDAIAAEIDLIRAAQAPAAA